MATVRRLDASKIHQARLRANLSLDDVAHLLRGRGFKTTASAIWRWENGKNGPAGDVLASLADALQTDIDSFFSEEDGGDAEEGGRAMRLRKLQAELVLSGRDDLAADLAALARMGTDGALVEPATGAGAGSTSAHGEVRAR